MKFQKKLTRTEMRNISGGTGQVGAPVKKCGEDGASCSVNSDGYDACCVNYICKVYAFNMGNCQCAT